jgi:hypothetical protein
VVWRPGSAHTAAGAIAWLRTLVGRLRGLGVQEITVRLDKGFFSQEMIEALRELGVWFYLKLPEHTWVLRKLGSWRQSGPAPIPWTVSDWGGSARRAEGRRVLILLSLDSVHKTLGPAGDRRAEGARQCPGIGVAGAAPHATASCSARSKSAGER